VPALGKWGDKTRGAELVWLLVGAEEVHIVLAERQVDLGEVIQGSNFARIGRFQPDVGHGFSDGFRFVLPPVVVLTRIFLLMNHASASAQISRQDFNTPLGQSFAALPLDRGATKNPG
jgi:hypothetical protein